MGLDPGSVVSGWGVVSGSPRRAEIVGYGCLRPPRGASRAVRLAHLSRALREVLEAQKPDVVAVETPFTARFPAAALALAEARGALLAVLGEGAAQIVEYEPAFVKAAIVGNGRADKRQVAFIVRHTLSLTVTPPADAADALALALCHLRQICLDA